MGVGMRDGRGRGGGDDVLRWMKWNGGKKLKSRIDSERSANLWSVSLHLKGGGGTGRERRGERESEREAEIYRQTEVWSSWQNKTRRHKCWKADFRTVGKAFKLLLWSTLCLILKARTFNSAGFSADRDLSASVSACVRGYPLVGRSSGGGGEGATTLLTTMHHEVQQTRSSCHHIRSGVR